MDPTNTWRTYTMKAGSDSAMPRRKFLKMSAASVGAVGNLGSAPGADIDERPGERSKAGLSAPSQSYRRRPYNEQYSGEQLAHVAFPLGGIGAGLLVLVGHGARSVASLGNTPEVLQ